MSLSVLLSHNRRRLSIFGNGVDGVVGLLLLLMLVVDDRRHAQLRSEADRVNMLVLTALVQLTHTHTRTHVQTLTHTYISYI